MPDVLSAAHAGMPVACIAADAGFESFADHQRLGRRGEPNGAAAERPSMRGRAAANAGRIAVEPGPMHADQPPSISSMRATIAGP